ncbi:MAG: hypothetical protein M0036_18955 [Desulfobacteraceae bacterium]|nr:hypothetical protein [Desulfobacteraceae bacterium]
MDRLKGLLAQSEYDLVTDIYNRVAQRVGAPAVDHLWDEQAECEYWVEN